MRKRDPNQAIDGFRAEVEHSMRLLHDLHAALLDEPIDLRKVVSQDAFLRVVVAFEVFRSDWHIAAINRGSSQFRRHQTERVRQSVESKFAGTEQFVRVEVPRNLALQQITSMVDSEGRNVTFHGHKAWVERARQHLTGDYRKAVEGLALADFRLINAVVHIRNCLVHRSQQASGEMNTAIQIVQEPELKRATQRVRPSGLAHYLHARGNGQGPRRVEVIHHRLGDIATKLRL